MGREIRFVKKGWEHPRDRDGNYIPMFDEDRERVVIEWLCKGPEANGKGKCSVENYEIYAEWIEDAPYLDSYRKEKWEKDDEMYIQLYENVSEGTPLSPPFKTENELANYLAKKGDFWGGKWTKKQVIEMCQQKSVPSFLINGEKIYTAQEMLDVE